VTGNNDKLKFYIGDVRDFDSVNQAMKGVDYVFHAAALKQVPSCEFYPMEAVRTNVMGTENVMNAATANGVKRLVVLSTDKAVYPINAMGISKAMAEKLMVAIIRPPLVYGPGVKANFAAIILWLKRGVPLPLGAIHNQRSLVALDNLVDLIVTCLTHPAAANQTFLASDGEDVSTTELLRRMGKALGRPARLIPVPASWLKLAAAMVGNPDVAHRLCGSLQVDIEKTRRLLGWTPPVSLDEGLKKAAEGLRV
jgi:FlaA1/EpsC-like NDP-sugar epimerase